MSINSTPSAHRTHIAFFGCRNVGKSSLVNAVTAQQLSVVSDVKGTTTDAVKKTMELLPLGPCVIIDTPGYDDEGDLGSKRVAAADKILRSCDIAVLVTAPDSDYNSTEKLLISMFKKRNIPFIIAKNKADTIPPCHSHDNIVYTSATLGAGVELLKNTIASLAGNLNDKPPFLGDLISENDIVVLVTPIDSAAPKGRLIMPQQLAVRDIIDHNAISLVVKETQLETALSSLSAPPALVVTDSQAFSLVSRIVPDTVPLTSFSILMARFNGVLTSALLGANLLDSLAPGSEILISEGCTHHRQCDDIGTVKLPRWIEEYTQNTHSFSWSSGTSFPNNLTDYDLIIHCGGCMLKDSEMQYRLAQATAAGVPFTNYGVAIAKMKGILPRAIAML